MFLTRQREKRGEKEKSEEKREFQGPYAMGEWRTPISRKGNRTNRGKRSLCHNRRYRVVIVLVGLHMAVELRLRNITLGITPRSLPHLVAIGEVTDEGLAIGVHPQFVDLQVRPPHEGLVAARHVALVLLVDLRSTRYSALT